MVSLDSLLNKNLVPFDQNNKEDWEHLVIYEDHMTSFDKSLDYVLKRTILKDLFNLLAVAIEPEKDCKNIKLNDFEFIGYDLLDTWSSISSLTNCDGFILSYTPDDINQYALLKDFEKAYDIRKRLLEDNKGHEHEDTQVIGVWRRVVVG